jgi:hypothetical protein
MITELRYYRIKPEKLDSWVRFFAEAVRENERQGMPIEFAGVDRDTSTYVYARSFQDEAQRQAVKAGFYEGPWWLEHEDFAMDHVVEYRVEFLDTAIVRRESGLTEIPIDLASERPGSRGDDPPAGWVAWSGRTWSRSHG